MNTSKQKIISFQGALGANSDLACRDMYPDWQTLPCETFYDAFEAVKTDRADCAMIAIDNTLAGRVADVHHLLPESGLFIIGEYFSPIRHTLLGVKGAKLSELTDVYSHVHAVSQCRNTIRALGLNAHIHADTAGAAKDVAQNNNPKHGAIASTLAAEIYGLDILKENIQDEDHNTTRFIVLSKNAQSGPRIDRRDYVTSMILRVRNIPAALYKALGGFATNGVNMLKLESYISPDFQVAQFYIDVQGHVADHNIKLAIEELEFFAAELSVLGSYEAHPFRKNINMMNSDS